MNEAFRRRLGFLAGQHEFRRVVNHIRFSNRLVADLILIIFRFSLVFFTFLPIIPRPATHRPHSTPHSLLHSPPPTVYSPLTCHPTRSVGFFHLSTDHPPPRHPPPTPLSPHSTPHSPLIRQPTRSERDGAWRLRIRHRPWDKGRPVCSSRSAVCGRRRYPDRGRSSGVRSQPTGRGAGSP